MEMTGLMEAAKNLGAPGLALVSIAVILVWLSREAMKLRRDIDKRNLDLASSIIKLWNELNNTSGEGSERI